MNPVTILVADDHAIVRRGILSLLGDAPDLQVVGEVADGLEAIERVERLQPDLLILDLMLPGLSGLEVARRVSMETRRTRVLVHSMYEDEYYVREALRQGAAGYVLKGAHGVDLPEAVRTVMAGRPYLSPPLGARSLDLSATTARAGKLDMYDTLTNREREVLQLAAEGFSSAEIGARLSISSRTVETHRAHLMQKLGLKNQTALIRFAFRRGLLSME